MVWDPVTGEVVSNVKHVKYQQKKRQQQAPSASSQEGTVSPPRYGTAFLLFCHLQYCQSLRLLILLVHVQVSALQQHHKMLLLSRDNQKVLLLSRQNLLLLMQHMRCVRHVSWHVRI